MTLNSETFSWTLSHEPVCSSVKWKNCIQVRKKGQDRNGSEHQMSRWVRRSFEEGMPGHVVTQFSLQSAQSHPEMPSSPLTTASIPLSHKAEGTR